MNIQSSNHSDNSWDFPREEPGCNRSRNPSCYKPLIKPGQGIQKLDEVHPRTLTGRLILHDRDKNSENQEAVQHRFTRVKLVPSSPARNPRVIFSSSSGLNDPVFRYFPSRPCDKSNSSRHTGQDACIHTATKHTEDSGSQSRLMAITDGEVGGEKRGQPQTPPAPGDQSPSLNHRTASDNISLVSKSSSRSFPLNRSSLAYYWDPPHQNFYQSQRSSTDSFGRRRFSREMSTSAHKSKPSSRKSSTLSNAGRLSLFASKPNKSKLKFSDKKPRSKEQANTKNSSSAENIDPTPRTPEPNPGTKYPNPSQVAQQFNPNRTFHDVGSTQSSPIRVQKGGDQGTAFAKPSSSNVSCNEDIGAVSPLTKPSTSQTRQRQHQTSPSPPSQQKPFFNEQWLRDANNTIPLSPQASPASTSERGTFSPPPPSLPPVPLSRNKQTSSTDLNTSLWLWLLTVLGVNGQHTVLGLLKFVLFKMITVWFLSTFLSCLKEQALHHIRCHYGSHNLEFPFQFTTKDET